MEGTTSIERAREIMGINFLGAEELRPLLVKLKSEASTDNTPSIPFSEEVLTASRDQYILILGIPSTKDGQPINIERLRNVFGLDPAQQAPCFYNQDWYLKENFIQQAPQARWYLLRKYVIQASRAQRPEQILEKEPSVQFPPAVICAYTFFAYYLHANGELLWQYDFIWCCDTDHNGDRIYVGKYTDIDGVNKDGFSIHRHLALRDCYGAISLQ